MATVSVLTIELLPADELEFPRDSLHKVCLAVLGVCDRRQIPSGLRVDHEQIVFGGGEHSISEIQRGSHNLSDQISVLGSSTVDVDDQI